MRIQSAEIFRGMVSARCFKCFTFGYQMTYLEAQVLEFPVFIALFFVLQDIAVPLWSGLSSRASHFRSILDIIK